MRLATETTMAWFGKLGRIRGLSWRKGESLGSRSLSWVALSVVTLGYLLIHKYYHYIFHYKPGITNILKFGLLVFWQKKKGNKCQEVPLQYFRILQCKKNSVRYLVNKSEVTELKQKYCEIWWDLSWLWALIYTKDTKRVHSMNNYFAQIP